MLFEWRWNMETCQCQTVNLYSCTWLLSDFRIKVAKDSDSGVAFVKCNSGNITGDHKPSIAAGNVGNDVWRAHVCLCVWYKFRSRRTMGDLSPTLFQPNRARQKRNLRSRRKFVAGCPGETNGAVCEIIIERHTKAAPAKCNFTAYWEGSHLEKILFILINNKHWWTYWNNCFKVFQTC